MSNFQKLLKDFKQTAKTAAQDPTPNQIHRLRIITRKIRSAFWLFKHSQKIKVPHELRSRLTDLGRQLGSLRELDVLLKDAATYHLNDNERLQKSLEKRLKKSRQLQSTLDGNFQTTTLKNLSLVLKSVTPLPATTSKDLRSTLKRNIKTCHKKIPKDKKSQHQMRIEVKKTIYRLELLGEKSPALRKIQKHLGRIHDLEVLQKHFGKQKIFFKHINKSFEEAQRAYRNISKSSGLH